MNLQTTGLSHNFQENILSYYDIGKWKLDQAIFLHAALVMGYEVEDCLVIEDTIIGVEAAKAGGFDVLGFANNYHEVYFHNKSTRVFHSMDDLLHLVSSST
ncbi:hypothetical protein FGM00_01885 [Aggregatimonas sangjinii]|uniref:HAD family hydrolase n=1 Tax=Aggregatimonas sangjinii TaxID=2583587 RepID=A0A5B7SKA7_9FLAO|nr:HAD-IA family hydrolase [Aggregatimonas sangjinii]QCW98924.1 hypothetical protein FGM00_01885 [Aggregatimonas sangjinii]